MNHLREWYAIAVRIRGLVQAGQLYGQLVTTRSAEGHGSQERLREQCASILAVLYSYVDSHRHILAADTFHTIQRFLDTNRRLVDDVDGSADIRHERAKAALVALAAFETEVSYLLSDSQEIIRSRAERAFAHLQRSIVVDPTIRERWQQAYEQGEVHCEKLGAVHLLLHGIWAFKVDAQGARTDLVYEEPLRDHLASRIADGLVLTEWKRAAVGEDAPNRFTEARRQAQRYSQGVLSGSELAGYRFVVVVSYEDVHVPDALPMDGVVYYHVNIAVNPQTPSRLARSASATA